MDGRGHVRDDCSDVEMLVAVVLRGEVRGPLHSRAITRDAAVRVSVWRRAERLDWHTCLSGADFGFVHHRKEDSLLHSLRRVVWKQTWAGANVRSTNGAG